MKLVYSESGIPVIEMGDKGRLIFSRNTMGPKGYKYLCYSGKSTITVSTSASKGKKSKKKSKEFTVSNNESCIINVDITPVEGSSIPKTLRTKNGPFSNMNIKTMKSTLCKYIVEDHIPESSIKEIEQELNMTENELFTDEDLMEDDPTATESYDDVDENEKPKKKKLGKAKGKPLKIKPKVKIKLNPKK